MILSSQIQNHLRLYLSWFTDLFSVIIPSSGAEVLANNVVKVTANNHGLINGDYIFIADGTVRNSLINVSVTNGDLIFETEFNHDFIKPSQINDVKYLSLNGFAGIPDEDLNGQHFIENISKRTKFTIKRPDSIVSPPDISNAYLIENRPAGIKGVFQVTYIDNDNFSYQVVGVPTLPINPIDNIKVISSFRIAAVADVKRAQELYTTHDDPYLFVIMGDVDVSKSSNSKTDAKVDMTNQDFNLLTFLQNFGIAVFIPTSDDVTGEIAQDLAFGEIFNSLISILYAYRFKNQNTINPYKLISNGHGPANLYNTAYYVHVYDWQQSSTLNYEANLIRDIESVAFRNIEMNIFVNDQDIEKLTFNLNLDEVK